MSEKTALEEKLSELTEEQKLEIKFPGKKPVTTHVLKKKMERKVKYFDSGDYAMAKSEIKGGLAGDINSGNSGHPHPFRFVVGKVIPTPENIPHPLRETSVPSKLLETHNQPPFEETK